jgi:hypothetical protein
MRIPTFSSCLLAAIVTTTNFECSSGATGLQIATGWGSDQASLTNASSSATLRIAAGGCYGSFGQTDEPISTVSFTLNGTYTQFTGVSPGQVRYPAQFVGTVDGDRMHISVQLPALHTTVGPFELVRGVESELPQCLYP